MFPMAYGVLPACSPQPHRPLCGLRVFFSPFSPFSPGVGVSIFYLLGPAYENWKLKISFSVYAAPGRIKSRGVAGSVQGKKIFCSFQLTVESCSAGNW